jgi:hypothetical protein
MTLTDFHGMSARIGGNGQISAVQTVNGTDGRYNQRVSSTTLLLLPRACSSTILLLRQQKSCSSCCMHLAADGSNDDLVWCHHALAYCNLSGDGSIDPSMMNTTVRLMSEAQPCVVRRENCTKPSLLKGEFTTPLT